MIKNHFKFFQLCYFSTNKPRRKITEVNIPRRAPHLGPSSIKIGSPMMKSKIKIENEINTFKGLNKLQYLKFVIQFQMLFNVNCTILFLLFKLIFFNYIIFKV